MALLEVKNITINIGREALITSEEGLSVSPGDVVLLSGGNGCGKSTLIRMIMDDLGNSGITAQADISFRGQPNISKSEKGRQAFNQSVCYVPQSDEFEAERLLDCCLTSMSTVAEIQNKEEYILNFVKQHRFYAVCYPDSITAELGWSDRYAKRLLTKCGIPVEQATQADIKSAMFLAKNPERLSGGQKKIANIVSAIVRCEFSDLLIIDEPLNALDYENVRLLSNAINRIHHEQPKSAMIIVTHCRAITAITRIISVANKTILEENENIACNSCFGAIDSNGFYSMVSMTEGQCEILEK